MAHPRRAPSRGFGRAQKRLTQWVLGPGGDDLITLDAQDISASASVILGTGVTPVTEQSTVIRIHGFLEVALGAADAAFSGFSWAAGIGIVTGDAFAIGATATPDPFDDIEWPGWMWHASGSIRTSQGAVAVGDPSINPVLVSVESKSMRILRLNEVLGFFFQTGETGTSSVRVRALTRILVKVP